MGLNKIFHHPSVAAISGWLAIIAAAGTGASWLLSHIPEWFGTLTWQQTSLLGFSFAIVALFLTACTATLLAVAYRRIWPSDVRAIPETVQTPSVQVEEVERLRELAQASSDAIDGINARLAGAEKESAELAIRNKFEFERIRNKVLSDLGPDLAKFRTSIEQYEDYSEKYRKREVAPGATIPSLPRAPQGLIDKMVSVGISRDVINAAVMARHNEINTHNSYILVDDSDLTNRWKDGAEKKRWHQNRAEAVAIDSIISGLMIPAAELTDEALLSKLQQHRMMPRVR